MSIPGQEAVVRFQENEERLDAFVNGDTFYVTRFGDQVPTLKVLAENANYTFSANLPLQVTAGHSPVLSIAQSSAVADGYLNKLDWAKFNSPLWGMLSGNIIDQSDLVGELSSKENNLGSPSVSGYVLSSTANGVRSWVAPSVGTTGVNSVTGTAPIASSGGNNPAISIAAATASVNGYMTATYASKLDNIAANANNYVHPANHSPSIITQDSSNRFVTDAEKASWSAAISFTAITGQPTDNANLATALALKAPLASPTFTGDVTLSYGGSTRYSTLSANAAARNFSIGQTQAYGTLDFRVSNLLGGDPINAGSNMMLLTSTYAAFAGEVRATSGTYSSTLTGDGLVLTSPSITLKSGGVILGYLASSGSLIGSGTDLTAWATTGNGFKVFTDGYSTTPRLAIASDGSSVFSSTVAATRYALPYNVVSTLWGAGYGGAVQVLSDNATATRWARIGIVNSTGIWQGGMTVDNDAKATFDGAVSMNALKATTGDFTGNVSVVKTDARISVKGGGSTSGFLIEQDGSKNAYLWNYDDTPITFGINGAQAMQLTSTGLAVTSGVTATGFNSSGGNFNSQTNLVLNPTGSSATYVNYSGGTGGTYFCNGSGGVVATITASGAIGATSVTINTKTNTNAELVLNPYSDGLGTAYQWSVVGSNSSSGYAFQIRDGSTTHFSIGSSAGGNAGEAILSSSLRTKGSNKATFVTDNPSTYYLGLGPTSTANMAEIGLCSATGVWQAGAVELRLGPTNLVYHSGNIEQSASALMAVQAYALAPQWVAALPALPDAKYPKSIYNAVTGRYDGGMVCIISTKAMYQNRDNAWVSVGSDYAIFGQVTAAQISAQSIGAGSLVADLVMSSKIRTSGSTKSTSAPSKPSGVWIDGNAFTTYYMDGTHDDDCRIEIGGSANINGYKAATIANRVMGNNPIYSSPNTYDWVCPEGITLITIKLSSGCGGGAGGAVSGGGGGGGGGATIQRKITVVPGTTYRIIVGSGGSAGAAQGNGGSGGATSMAYLSGPGSGFSAITLYGGGGGTGSIGGAGANAGSFAGGNGGTLDSVIEAGGIGPQHEHFEQGWLIPGAGGGGGGYANGAVAPGGYCDNYLGGPASTSGVTIGAGGGGGATGRGKHGGQGGYRNNTGPVITAGTAGDSGYAEIFY